LYQSPGFNFSIGASTDEKLETPYAIACLIINLSKLQSSELFAGRLYLLKKAKDILNGFASIP